MSWASQNQPLATVEIRRTAAFDVPTSSFEKFSGDEPKEAPADPIEKLIDERPRVVSDDEVYDAVFVSAAGSGCVAIGTNSEELRLLNVDSGKCVLANGHSQTILCLDSPDWDRTLLASGSKDNSILFWRIRQLKQQQMEVDGDEDEQPDSGQEIAAEQVAVATGHTHSVSSIAFSHGKTIPFLVSVSHDTTLKMWPLTELIVKQEKGMETAARSMKLSASVTHVAHTKDINSVDVSANDKLCVTASMDKTAKLWQIDAKKGCLSLAATLGGHKRGVWCARFSKNLQLVATCSGDCTIKLFSLTDKTCTRTLEGHQFAVLSLLFIDKSAKLVSVDGGGLIKVWDVQKGTCEKTDEGHDEKIWCLRELPAIEAVSTTDRPKARFMTGGADGKLLLWEDQSEELRQKRQREQARRVEVQQTLDNLVQQDRHLEALLIALDLNQPFQCHKVLNKLLCTDEPTEIQRQQQLEFMQLIKRLNHVQLSTLLDYACQWNTNTRTYAIGQLVLNCVLRSVPPTELLKLPNIETIVKGFLPYSLRHYERLRNLRKNAAHLDYMFTSMRL